jgi:hypothetical protein
MIISSLMLPTDDVAVFVSVSFTTLSEEGHTFIQDHNLRPTQEGACYAEQLQLTGRQIMSWGISVSLA